jgi:hypothetical protein
MFWPTLGINYEVSMTSARKKVIIKDGADPHTKGPAQMDYTVLCIPIVLDR